MNPDPVPLIQPYIPQPVTNQAVRPAPRPTYNPTYRPAQPVNPRLVAPTPRVVVQPAPAAKHPAPATTPAPQWNKAAIALNKMTPPPTKAATGGGSSSSSGSYGVRNVAKSLFKTLRTVKQQQKQQKQQQREQERQQQQEEAGRPICYHGEAEARQQQEEEKALLPELFVQECGNTGRCYQEYCYAALLDCLGGQPDAAAATAGAISGETATIVPGTSPAGGQDAAGQTDAFATQQTLDNGGSITQGFGTQVYPTPDVLSVTGNGFAQQQPYGDASTRRLLKAAAYAADNQPGGGATSGSSRRLRQAGASDGEQQVLSLEPVGCPKGTEFTECYQGGVGDTLFTCFGPPKAPADDDQLTEAVQAACAVPAPAFTPEQAMGSTSTSAASAGSSSGVAKKSGARASAPLSQV